MSSPLSPNSNSPSDSDFNFSNNIKKVPVSKVPVGLAKGPNIKNVKSKINSFGNFNHKPAGGEKKIESQKLNWNTNSRVGSLENASHKPKGGKVRVTTQKLDWNARSKLGSLDNVKHVPGGGNVRIFDEKYTAGSKAASTRSGNSTPNASLPYMTDDLLKETEQKLSLKDAPKVNQ